MKVLLLTGYYLPGYKGGGPIKTIVNLTTTTSDIIEYKIVTSDRDLGDNKPYLNVVIDQWNQVGNSKVFYAKKGLKGIKGITSTVLNRDYDIIYLNSFFSVHFSLLPLLLAKLIGKPVVLGPRGEFSSGALSLKAFKKIPYIKLYKLLRLDRGILFQASSDFELTDIQKYLGEKNKYYIAEDIGSQQYANDFKHKENDSIKLVFLSRISPMKNLSYALKALKEVTCTAIFDIYGPIEDKVYWSECKKIIDEMPCHIEVTYKGSIQPIHAIKILSAYDLFFMPTKGENYSHVIAEALCAGLPILIADTTPWRNLQEQGIGWDLTLNNPDAFSVVINQLAAMPAGEHLKMREVVLEWAKNKFSQRDAIEANIAMFRYAFQKK